MFVKKLTKIKFRLVYWPFFPSDFLDVVPNYHIKSVFFLRKSNLHQYIGLFSLKNAKNGQFLPYFSFYPILIDFYTHFSSKSDLHWYTGHFVLEFSSFLPQIITKNQLLFSKIKFTLVYRPFFPFKNDQKWEILTILPSTVDILGSIFDILGRFAKMPHPRF